MVGEESARECWMVGEESASSFEVTMRSISQRTVTKSWLKVKVKFIKENFQEISFIILKLFLMHFLVMNWLMV